MSAEREAPFRVRLLTGALPWGKQYSGGGPCNGRGDECQHKPIFLGIVTIHRHRGDSPMWNHRMMADFVTTSQVRMRRTTKVLEAQRVHKRVGVPIISILPSILRLYKHQKPLFSILLVRIGVPWQWSETTMRAREQTLRAIDEVLECDEPLTHLKKRNRPTSWLWLQSEPLETKPRLHDDRMAQPHLRRLGKALPAAEPSYHHCTVGSVFGRHSRLKQWKR